MTVDGRLDLRVVIEWLVFEMDLVTMVKLQNGG
jgi:hypothetical protein